MKQNVVAAEPKHDALKKLPAISELLKNPQTELWLQVHPVPVVTECLRGAVASLREELLSGAGLGENNAHEAEVLSRTALLLERKTAPRVREAINATGIILHTGLGRAVFPAEVVGSILGELKGYCTLAVDRESGERLERDELVEDLLVELTGAEAATVVNNNAAATLLVLAALASGKEVVVSRGQLIEIGGSFRLPEVMAQSGARLREVGATNRTHLKDYQGAITADTAALLRVHPSNYRVVGFTAQPELAELAALAHSRGLLLMDDLGAGALMDLTQFGLPHEPTVRESIQAGADLVWFSGDKLIGAGQAGIIVGRKAHVARLRKHPLMRSVRVDKTCLLVLERTLQLFRDPERLKREHPTYRMICTPLEVLRARAESLLNTLKTATPGLLAQTEPGEAFLGSGSLPTEALASLTVTLSMPSVSAAELARRLRLDPACIFGRIEADRVRLDMRTITDPQVPAIAAALGRVYRDLA